MLSIFVGARGMIYLISIMHVSGGVLSLILDHSDLSNIIMHVSTGVLRQILDRFLLGRLFG